MCLFYSQFPAIILLLNTFCDSPVLQRRHLSFKQMMVDDKEIPLTKAEYEICEFLARNRGQVFSKEQILEQIFGFDSESNDSTITTHIKNIRTKLSDHYCMPIKTVWGIGYKWEE